MNMPLVDIHNLARCFSDVKLEFMMIFLLKEEQLVMEGLTIKQKKIMN